jgi:hypothetical protein
LKAWSSWTMLCLHWGTRQYSGSERTLLIAEQKERVQHCERTERATHQRVSPAWS